MTRAYNDLEKEAMKALVILEKKEDTTSKKEGKPLVSAVAGRIPLITKSNPSFGVPGSVTLDTWIQSICKLTTVQDFVAKRSIVFQSK